MRANMNDFEMTFWDAPDDHARVIALADLAGRYWGTNDKLVTRFLAEIVCNESNSRDVRLCAYLDLFEVVNRPLTDIPHVNVVRDFKIPEDLDLSFVYEYLEGKKRG